jgi:RHS repeat-associated protein
VEYGYNENSQIDSLLYQNGAFLSLSYFNRRNWVTAQESRENKMGYTMDYYLNGNVKSRKVMGNYRLNYPLEVREMNSVYTYDKANRLTNVDRFNVKSYSPVEAFSYDKDGNLQTLTRDYSGDNFTYRYYSGTNRLMNITGTEVPQYIYDYNGNVTADSVRKITGITYDYRNLPVEMNITPNNGDRYKYKMRYKYDEAGNRIRKMKYRSRLGEENWTLYNDEVYIRDAKGNETAMYENSNLQYINIWGAGLEGKVRKDDRGNNLFSYYYKDHLGSVTAVMDGASGTITQSQDYDAWGDICRTYSTTDTTVNKFTGKERDQETGYDYFGARYYDSRIGRWLQTEPLYDKYLQVTPYCYGLLNPFTLKDYNGLDPRITIKDNVIYVDFSFYYVSRENDENKGLTEDQITIANNLIDNMVDKWSISVNYKGNNYSMKVSATLNEVNDTFDHAESKLFNDEEFYNMIESSTDEGLKTNTSTGVGVVPKTSTNGIRTARNNVIKIAKDFEIILNINTGAHECGHLFNLDDTDYWDIIMTSSNGRSEYKVNSIMGPVKLYNDKLIRSDPIEQDWINIINKNTDMFDF